MKKETIEQAKKETSVLLQKEMSYSFDFQKPERINFYKNHLNFLDNLGEGTVSLCDAPKPNAKNWDLIRKDLKN